MRLDCTSSGMFFRNAPAAEMAQDVTTRNLHLRADSVNEENRSVEATISSETPSMVYDWSMGRTIEEITLASGAEFPSKLPMLESHNRYSLDSVIGSVREISVQGDRIVARLYFADGDDVSERAWNKVRQGHITDVSVGYRVSNYVDIPAGKSQTINGRTFTAGERNLRVTTAWKIKEVSVVPIGADEAAKIRQSYTFLNKEVEMPPELRKFLESCGLKRSASNEGAWSFFRLLDGENRERAEVLKAESANDSVDGNGEGGEAEPVRSEPTGNTATPVAPVSAPTPQHATIDPAQIRQEAAVAERRRCERIRSLAGDDIPAEMVQRAIDGGWSAESAGMHFREYAIERSTPQVPAGTPNVITRDHERDCTERALGVGLMIRNGLNPIDSNASQERQAEQARLADQADRFSDMPLLRVCEESLRLSRVNIPHGRQEIVQRAMSTAALSHIFTTTVNASVMSAYTAAPDPTQGWVREVDVPDFKSNERIRMEASNRLKKLARGDTAAHTSRASTMEEYKSHRYAEQFVIDEQDVIDDRFDVLRTMPEEMGVAASMLRPDLVISVLLANANMRDGNALFDATNHLNYNSSSGALSAATLQAAIIAMANQYETDPEGKTRLLNISPAFLLIPQDLRFTAEVILQSAERIISSSSGGTYNPLRSMSIQPIADARFGVLGVTDPSTGTAYTGTATNFFLAGNPMQHPTIEVGYVSGSGRRPSIRSSVLDKGQWGIGWDIKMDIGAKALDWRALYKASGSGG